MSQNLTVLKCLRSSGIRLPSSRLTWNNSSYPGRPSSTTRLPIDTKPRRNTTTSSVKEARSMVPRWTRAFPPCLRRVVRRFLGVQMVRCLKSIDASIGSCNTRWTFSFDAFLSCLPLLGIIIVAHVCAKTRYGLTLVE